jgi:hypothetical protein
MIERKKYLDKLINKKGNGLVKVITGIRRCGKSYLLFTIYKNYLKSIGVADECIICLALDDDENIRYRNPIELGKYLRSLTSDESKTYYVFLDEIQKVVTIQNPYVQGVEDKIGFVDVVLGLIKHDNIDVYVTGSNSKMLSSDILTEFRGRGDEIRMSPLSYSEFYSAYEGDKRFAWQEYYTYGGMPYVTKLTDHRAKAQYLTGLFDNIYLSDILERHSIRDKGMLDEILGMNMERIGRYAGNSHRAVLIHASEVAHIDQETVVIVGDGIHQTLHAIAVLCDIAVVLGAGADAQLLAVNGDGADVLNHGREHAVEAAGVAALTQTIANIVSHDLRAEECGNIELTAQTVDLLLGGHALAEEVGADGVSIDVHTETVGLGAELNGIFLLLLQRGLHAVNRSQINEFNRGKTHLMRGGDGVKLGHLAGLDGLLEGIGADGKFHLCNHSFLKLLL